MNLTKKQKIMLDFIDGFVKGRGYSPTLREIMQALGYKSVSTVAKHVDNLVIRGWIVKREGEARSLEVLSEPYKQSSLSSEDDQRDAAKQLFQSRLSDTTLSAEDKQILEKAKVILKISEVKDETA